LFVCDLWGGGSHPLIKLEKLFIKTKNKKHDHSNYTNGSIRKNTSV